MGDSVEEWKSGMSGLEKEETGREGGREVPNQFLEAKWSPMLIMLSAMTPRPTDPTFHT